MSLSAAGLGAKIKDEIIAKLGSPTDSTQLEKVSDAIGKAVVDYITANAIVSSTGTVTSGAGAGGAVTATGTVS
jgi:hypothetical protein